MPRLQVDLPDDLYRAVKELGLPVPELLQEALRLEMRRRRHVLAATDEYLAELAAEVGEPTPEEAAAAEALVRRIVEHAKAAAV